MKNLMLEDDFRPPHFVCTGDCGTTSKVPGICKNQGCTQEGHEYQECNCEDGTHAELRKDMKPAQEITI